MTTVRLVVAIPTAGTVAMGFAYSLAGMIACIGANRFPSLPEATVEVVLDVVESSNWITNREQLVRRAIDAEKTHLLFLDDDMIFEPGLADCLLGRRQPIVVTNYLIKTEPAKDFVAVGLDGQRVHTTAQAKGLQPVAYSGFGASLFDLSVFKAMAQPWFLPDFVPATSSYTTEDNPCYRRMREAGFTVYLDHDASRMLSHVGRKAWNWTEVNHG